jgi:hypothetical protein
MSDCAMCGVEDARIVRTRKGRADYFCAGCMNVERDSADGVLPGDMWFAVKREHA